MIILVYPAFHGPRHFARKYPNQISDENLELTNSKPGFVPRVSGEERNVQRYLRQQRVFSNDPEIFHRANVGEEDHEGYVNRIASRPAAEAPRQVEMSIEVSQKTLYGPAPIQVPSPLQMIADQPRPMLKTNSTVVSSFEYIKGLLAMTKVNDRSIFKCKK